MTDTTPTVRLGVYRRRQVEVLRELPQNQLSIRFVDTGTRTTAPKRQVKEAAPVVETFSTFCFCKPPHLNADNVCSCGVAWSS